MQAFAKRPEIAPLIKQIYTGSGDEEIRFINGSRILFGARERGFGRGIPGVDVLVSDEGQILSERAMQNMLATLNTSQLGLHIYAGTPPKPEDNCETWMRMRDEAWVVEDPDVVTVETEDLVWVEIGADDDADLDDPDQWAKANPSFPHRTPLESIMRLRRKLNDDGFRREGLGLYDEGDGSIFDLDQWNRLADTDVDPPESVALVLDVSPDRRWSSIAVCGEIPDERDLVMVHSIRGTQGVVDRIVKLRDEHHIMDVAITPGAARALETDLVDAAVDYEVMTAGDMAACYANMQHRIKDDPPTMAHLDQPELNFALANAKSRYLQTGESESFDRRDYSLDISSAVAAAGALFRWGLNQHPLPLIL